MLDQFMPNKFPILLDYLELSIFTISLNLTNYLFSSKQPKVKTKQYRPRGYKTFFMLISIEHEISTAHENFNTDI